MGRVGPQGENTVGVGVGAQVGDHLVFDFARVDTRIDHLIAQLNAESICKARATFHRCGIGDVVVDTQKLGDTGVLGAEPSPFTGIILRLSYMQQRT